MDSFSVCVPMTHEASANNHASGKLIDALVSKPCKSKKFNFIEQIKNC